MLPDLLAMNLYLKNDMKRLSEEETKYIIENNDLSKLPCKPGDTFWELNNNFVEPVIYPRIAHSIMHCIYVLERLGEVTFLNEKDAQIALDKLIEKKKGEQ